MTKLLTGDHVRQFQELGYVAPFRAMSRADALACRRRIEAYEGSAGHDANVTLKIKGHLAFPWLVELGRNAAVLGRADDRRLQLLVYARSGQPLRPRPRQ